MDKADVMKLVKRGPHKTSCWAWRGMLWGGLPTVVKGELVDPGKILGAVSLPRWCKNKLCVNPAHREGAQEVPRLKPPPPPPIKKNTKARSLKLKSKQDADEKEATLAETAKTAAPAPVKVKPEVKPAPKAEKPAQAKQKPRKSTKTRKKAEKTHCGKGHPWIPENVWTSPTSGKSKCRVCERERKARTKAAKKK